MYGYSINFKKVHHKHCTNTFLLGDAVFLFLSHVTSIFPNFMMLLSYLFLYLQILMNKTLRLFMPFKNLPLN